MAYKTMQRVFVPNLKLFGSMATELWAKEIREFSVVWMYTDFQKVEQLLLLHLLAY